MRPSVQLLRLARAAGLVAALVGIGPAGTAGAAANVTAAPEADTDVIGEVTVEPTDGLPAEDAVVTVTGTGFDPAAGIYVAVCVDNGPGVKPSPCIGGVDTEGTGGATWISNDPPSYAEGLTVPYGPGGSFEVELSVPMVDDVTGVDCRDVACAVTVRYDHLRAEDRGADHVVPVTFAGADEGAGTGAGDEDAGEPGATDDAAGTEEQAGPEEDAADGDPADDGAGTEEQAGPEEDAADGDPADDGAAAAPAGAKTAEADVFPVLPVALVGVAALLLATWFLVRRRHRTADEPGPIEDNQT